MTNISDIELKRLQQAVQELTTLNEIARTISVSMTVDAITQVILDHCLRRSSATQGGVFLLDKADLSADKFRTFVREFDTGSYEFPLRLNATLTGWMLKHRTVLIWSSSVPDDRFPGIDFASFGIRSILAAPLMSHNNLIGVLTLFNKKGTSSFDDNDKRLLAIVGSQTAQVIENARLFEQEQRLKLIEEELKMATNIQAGFLPKNNLIRPDGQIAGTCLPAKQVGGDFYDILELADKRVFVSIGDVSDKGMPAALLMSNAQAVLRSNIARDDDINLSAVASDLNRLICQFSAPGQFITALLGIMDFDKRTFTYVNAGHPGPVVLKRNGTVQIFSDSDLIIGVSPACKYTEHSLSLSDARLVVLYTDGVTEAESAGDEQYGDTRLQTLVARSNQSGAAEVLDALIAELSKFRDGHPQSDDQTSVAIFFPDR